MELSDLFTDKAKTATKGVYENLYVQRLPDYLWPDRDTTTVFSEWELARLRTADEYAKPIWDEVRELLSTGQSSVGADAWLSRIQAHVARVDLVAGPRDIRARALDYALVAFDAELRWAGDDTIVQDWLGGDGNDKDRPAWTWENDGDVWRLFVHGMSDVLGPGQPTGTVDGSTMWEAAIETARGELEALRTDLAPLDELRAALRFQSAVIERALAHYAVDGSLSPYVPRAEVDFDGPFPMTHEGAEDVSVEDKEAFVRAAHTVIENARGDRTFGGKLELLTEIQEELDWSRDRAKDTAVAIGAYRKRGRGRSLREVELEDLNQFASQIGELHRRL
ncbi:hypothetical protein [Rubrivirga sp.]|uniref:hypothetical protein n=1 Tax=Rubrivirga sp. TaxID=1885344 RepID=UPI003C7455FD